MRKGKLMGKIFGIALVLVMVEAVLPCSDYISTIKSKEVRRCSL